MNPTFPYPSQRMPVIARNVVASSQPLAVQAGIAMLQLGGNAVDAALATAIALTVVEPTSNGIGSDGYSISGTEGTAWPECIGPIAHRVDARYFNKKHAGIKTIPERGWDSDRARRGVSVGGALRKIWQASRTTLRASHPLCALWPSCITDHLRKVGRGRSKRCVTSRFRATSRTGPGTARGEKWTFEAQAATLEEIAATRGEESFIAARWRKNRHTKANGGAMTNRISPPIARTGWVRSTPAIAMCGCNEIPPNGQGLAALIALGILKHFDLASHPVDSTDSAHLQIEAMKLAFADVFRFLIFGIHGHARGCTAGRPITSLRAKLIDMKRAGQPAPGIPKHGGTVYLTAADSGMMVSFIQSNFHGRFWRGGLKVPAFRCKTAATAVRTIWPPERSGASEAQPFPGHHSAFHRANGKPLTELLASWAYMQPQGMCRWLTRMIDLRPKPANRQRAPRWW